MGVARSTSKSSEQRLLYYLINYCFVNSHITVFKISISYVKNIYLLKQVEVMKYYCCSSNGLFVMPEKLSGKILLFVR